MSSVGSTRIDLLLQRPTVAIMGIVNTTPDSFSDGGQFLSSSRALDHAFKLIDEGADIIDVGGESTRPGAEQVTLQVELDRVMPVVEKLRAESDIVLSVDTYKPEVMHAATDIGVDMVNDVNGLRAEGAIPIVADSKAAACIMHMQGQPKDMQTNPRYQNVVDDVLAFFESRIALCEQASIVKSRLILDPGIGFGKTLDDNLALLKALPIIRRKTACEVMVGVSRKSLIDKLLGRPVAARLPASLGLAVQAALNGAKIIRVHDVQASFDAIRSVEAVRIAQSACRAVEN